MQSIKLVVEGAKKLVAEYELKTQKAKRQRVVRPDSTSSSVQHHHQVAHPLNDSSTSAPEPVWSSTSTAFRNETVSFSNEESTAVGEAVGPSCVQICHQQPL